MSLGPSRPLRPGGERMESAIASARRLVVKIGSSLLTGRGIKCSVVGEFAPRERGMVLIRQGKEQPLRHPIVDPFWKAFYAAMEKYKSP